MEIQFAARTDVGLSRDHNEDNFLVDSALELFLVADGMGGHSAGEVASAMAVNETLAAIREGSAILGAFKADPASEEARLAVHKLLEHSVQDACFKIYDRGMNNPRQRGMGTTLTLMIVLGSRAFVAHVGDSRLYLSREGMSHQMTHDHSLVDELIKHGKIRSLKDLDHRFKNAVTRAVGVYETVEVDVLDFDLFPGDRVLICSDGLHGYMDDATVERETRRSGLEAVAEALIQFANRKGGRDNITCVVVETLGTDADEAHRRQKLTMMRRLDLFGFLNFRELAQVVHITRETQVAEGTVLFREGEEDEALYIILSGTVALTREGTELAEVGAGTHFGEMALVDRTTRSATAKATTDLRLLVIERDAFYRLLRNNTSVAVKTMWSFVKSLSHRLRETSGELVALQKAVKEGKGQGWTSRNTVPNVTVMSEETGIPEALGLATGVQQDTGPPPPPPIALSPPPPPGTGGPKE